MIFFKKNFHKKDKKKNGEKQSFFEEFVLQEHIMQ